MTLASYHYAFGRDPPRNRKFVPPAACPRGAHTGSENSGEGLLNLAGEIYSAEARRSSSRVDDQLGSRGKRRFCTHCESCAHKVDKEERGLGRAGEMVAVNQTDDFFKTSKS